MPTIKFPFSGFILCGCFLMAVAPGFAETLPSAETAGAQDTRLKENSFYKDKTRPPPEENKKSIELPAAHNIQSQAKFHLNNVVFEGNQSIPATDLQPFVASLLNKDITLGELQEAANAIAMHYRQKGFVACYVFVPAQHIKDGIARISIVEGNLGKLTFTDNHWFSSKILRSIFRTKEGEPLKYNALREDLLQLNRHRDVQGRVVLKPGEVAGTTDAEVKIKDNHPFHLSTDINNLGTRNTGRLRYGTTFVDTNLSGRLDQLLLRYETGKGERAFLSDYIIPLSADLDTRLGFSFSKTHVDVGGDFAPLDIKGDATTYSPYVLQPLYEREHLQITGKLGMDIKSVKNRALGDVSGHDELRILNTAFIIEQQDQHGRTFSNQEFATGFNNFLGSSDKIEETATRTNTGAKFFAYRGDVTRYQWLAKDIMLSLSGQLQLTPNRLVPSEQLRLGGANSIRGYQEGEYLSDYGGYTSAEIFLPAYIFPLTWHLPFSKEPLRKQVQFVTFTDIGYGGIHHAALGETKHRTLAGAGGGVRIHLFDKVFARLEWAAPIGSKANDNRHSIFYFGISVDLF